MSEDQRLVSLEIQGGVAQPSTVFHPQASKLPHIETPSDYERLRAEQNKELIPARCPHCDKKIAEGFRGKVSFMCPRCKRRSTLTN